MMIKFDDLEMNEAYELSDSIKVWKFRGYRKDGKAIFGWWNSFEGDEELRLVERDELAWLTVSPRVKAGA
jgi:hypothetical protein